MSTSSRPTVALFMDYSFVGIRCARELFERAGGCDVVCVVKPKAKSLHEMGDFRIYQKDWLNSPVFETDAPEKDPRVLQALSGGVDLILSCWYGRRIRPELLRLARRGGVNLHPAVLPYNRGRHSAFWAIHDGTPYGATIHWMDETLDTGDIIDQVAYQDDGLVKAQDVYARQEQASLDLFSLWLPGILDGTAPRKPQPAGGTYHHAKDIQAATRFKAEDVLPAGRLLRLVRGTAMGGNGIYVTDGGRTFKIQGMVTEVTE